MAETTKKKGQKGKAAHGIQDIIPVETGAVVLEELDGFTPEEVARMAGMRDRIKAGEYSDLTKEYRKLLFVQWLIEHDKLRS